MTIEEIRSAANDHLVFLLERGLRPERMDSELHLEPLMTEPQRLTLLRHATWMCGELTTFQEDKIGKANRWLGHIQGILLCCGISSISQLKNHNRSESEA